MALQDMAYELSGRVPNLDIDLAVTMVREAWHSVRKLRGWSWQLGQGGFAAPARYSNGTVSMTYGGTTITGDATASAGWATLSQFGSLITQRQFRVGGGTIYNIVAANFSNPSAVVLTLDRPFIDYQASYSGVSYIIYQPYYAAPVKDFIRWLAIRDMTNVRWLNVDADYDQRRQTDMADPQRQIYTLPLMVLPYYVDQRPNSSTLGYMMYELYPQPSSQIVYQTWYEWEGPDIVNPTDTLPTPITEKLVKCLALMDAYGWAEGNKNPQNPRGAGADFRFLVGQYKAMYDEELKACRVNDRERVNLFSATMTRVGSPAPFSTWNPATGVLSVSNLAQSS
jgi:hypothetical protein